MIAGAADLQVVSLLRETDPERREQLLTELDRAASFGHTYPNRDGAYRKITEGPQLGRTGYGRSGQQLAIFSTISGRRHRRGLEQEGIGMTGARPCPKRQGWLSQSDPVWRGERSPLPPP
ncbi:hypothetical protein AB0L88_38335 [Saccharopolyspora shandongensis]|uniref:Uncharacterized protein n=1 Tax=Saccharopolyspora shandongensis TaxID=418495 RepID=A0A1H3QV59_9PSEU|nr:hypothetical protein [Saccharopolyspora shandongensis]SDZ16609.1 hypothetical protein SAMN05216215_104968 [Saccharopolyspora shandongensis]